MRSKHVVMQCAECNARHEGYGPTFRDAEISARKSLKECSRRHRLDARREAILEGNPTYQMAQRILAVWDREGIGA